LYANKHNHFVMQFEAIVHSLAYASILLSPAHIFKIKIQRQLPRIIYKLQLATDYVTQLVDACNLDINECTSVATAAMRPMSVSMENDGSLDKESDVWDAIDPTESV